MHRQLNTPVSWTATPDAPRGGAWGGAAAARHRQVRAIGRACRPTADAGRDRLRVLGAAARQRAAMAAARQRRSCTSPTTAATLSPGTSAYISNVESDTKIKRRLGLPKHSLRMGAARVLVVRRRR